MKYLKAFCGHNVLLFKLDNIVEVINSDSLKMIKRNDLSESDELNTIENIVFHTHWRELNVDLIDLRYLFNHEEEKNLPSYIVTAKESDIKKGNNKKAVVIAVDGIDRIVEHEDGQVQQNLDFSDTGLAQLFNDAFYNEQDSTIELVINLPLKFDLLMGALHNSTQPSNI